MPETSFWGHVKYKVYALILVAIIVVLGIVAAAAYNRAFTPSIPVTLHADRAGLQMHPGNRVKIRGVDLGRVTEVSLNDTDDTVTIQLALDPELSKQVPANVTVSLEQLTAFGNKSVQLNYPANPSPESLKAGTVISADHVSTEINSTFDELMTLLTEIQPSKLNATLGALAQTVQGKGDSIGMTITKANAYLKKFNTNLPALQNDFRVTAGFANVYADSANDIADLVRNAGVASATIGDKDVNWPGLMNGLHGVGTELDDFFAENANPLTDMLSSLRPTTSLLAKYSPALTCFLDGAAVTHDQLQTRLFDESGAQFEVNLQYGSGPYRYETDLPEVGPGTQPGPNCRGLPVVTPNEFAQADYTTSPRRFNEQTSNTPSVGGGRPLTIQGYDATKSIPGAKQGER